MTYSLAKDKSLNPKHRPTVEPHELISSNELAQIRDAIIQNNAEDIIKGMLDPDARTRLENYVKREFRSQTKGNMDLVRYIVRETIGTGVIEDILSDESITDIGFNGRELIIESNDNKQIFDTNFEIDDRYIIRLISKFANANQKEFTTKNPVFDGRFENVRINAVHSQNTAPGSGTTMSLRVVRPRLALTEDNFEGFAPMYVLDFLEAAALTKSNIVISGTTGTGKTELHKLISSFIPFDDRILLIEDTPETFMKEMFPEKDVYSWVTGYDVTVTDLIKAGLRNNPAWIMVTETRGMEAYEMIQAVLSGHSIITSLHATSASAIPTRFVNMAKMGYELSEEALIDDIRRYFNFGIHIKKVKYKGMVIRYLSEILEFNPEGNHTIFKQRFVDGVFHFESYELSDEFKLMMEEAMVEVSWPESFKSERPLNPDDVTFEATIPLDDNGRPDLEALDKMGTSVAVLMGREAGIDVVPEDNFKVDTDESGFITPESVSAKPVDENQAKIDRLKREQARKQEREEAKARQSRNRDRQKDKSDSLDATSKPSLERIMNKLKPKIETEMKVRKTPVPEGFVERFNSDEPIDQSMLERAKAKLGDEKVRTTEDIVREKRQEINDRDV